MEYNYINIFILYKNHTMTNEQNKLIEWIKKVGETLKYNGKKIQLTLALLAVLTMATPKSAEAQTLVKNKQHEEILQGAKNSQETIGEDMAKFIRGGWIERWLQIEIEKQNSKHGDKYEDKDFSLFKNKSVQTTDEKGKILSKKAMEDQLKKTVDSLVTNDVATFYLAFQNYQKSGVNIVGNKKWKGELLVWWNLAWFPVDQNVDYLEKNKSLPYTKEDLEKIQQDFEKIYESELSAWKSIALENRKNMDKNTYESANLLALEEAREKIVQRIFEKYIQPIIEKTFNQFYSTKEDKKK